MNYKELIYLQLTKGAATYNSRKGCCMNGKKIWKGLLGEKHLLGKLVYLFVKNTVNEADTWGSFSNSFSPNTGQKI